MCEKSGVTSEEEGHDVENDVAEETMSAMVKLAKETDEPVTSASRESWLHREMSSDPCRAEQKTPRSVSRRRTPRSARRARTARRSRQGGRVAEHESVLVKEFDQVEGGACVLGDQRSRNGEGNQFFVSEL